MTTKPKPRGRGRPQGQEKAQLTIRLSPSVAQWLRSQPEPNSIVVERALLLLKPPT